MSFKPRPNNKLQARQQLYNKITRQEIDEFVQLTETLATLGSSDAEPDDEESSIDFVEWKRFVGLLRESADELAKIDREQHADVEIALTEPRLREAATRIEKTAALANQQSKSGEFAGPLAREILKILNGKS